MEARKWFLNLHEINFTGLSYCTDRRHEKGKNEDQLLNL